MASVKNTPFLIGGFTGALIILMLAAVSPTDVYALNGFIDPNADGSTGAWGTTGAAHFSEVDEAIRQPTPGNVGDSVSNAANNGSSLFLNMTSIVGVTTATDVTVWVYHNDGSNGQLQLQLYDDDEITTRSGVQNVAQSTTDVWSSVTFSGLSLTQLELDNLSVELQTNKNGGGAPATITVYSLYLDVTYTNITTDLEQSSYRMFDSINSTDVGAPLAAQNGGGVLNASGDSFRLRLLLHVSGADLALSAKNLKLQFVDRGGGSCAVPSGGTPASYTDVTGGSLIAYRNLAGGVADGDAVTTNANDPTHAFDTIQPQTVEEQNNFTNSQSVVAVGEDGLWDFSLEDNSGSTATTYCFRVVESDGTLLNTYTQYPRITTGNGVLSIDIVDALAAPVINPVFTMSSTGYLFACEATAATIGDASQRIQISNFTATPSWNVTIAATAGATASWTDGGANTYDFNDSGGAPAGCSDSGDTDLVAGQLSIDPSLGTIAPQAGCTSTGISQGSSSSFSEGVNDSITLATASGSTELGCDWQFTGIPASQQIPQDQQSGSYSINLTLTVTAI